MSKLYIKVLTKDNDPIKFTSEFGLSSDKIMIKGTTIGEKGGKYGYNGFIINIANIDELENKLLFILSKIPKVGKIRNDIEIILNIVISGSKGFFIDNSLLRIFYDEGISLDIHGL